MKSLSKALYLIGLPLGLTMPSAIFASSPDTLAEMTLAEELSTRNVISPLYKPAAADAFYIQDVQTSVASQLDNAYLGTVTQTSSKLWGTDGSNDLYLNLLNSGGTGWENYVLPSLSASYNATTTINVTQTLNDGVSATTKIFKLILTAPSGTPPAVTKAALIAYLRASTTSTIAASTSGTTIAATGATLPTGWTLKGWLDNGSGTALAATIAPTDVVLSVPITPAPINGTNQSAITFTTSVLNLHSWNVTTGSTTTQDVIFTSPTGSYIYLKALPGKLVRTSNIAASLLAGLNTLPSKRISQANKSFVSSVASAATNVRALLTATPGSNSMEKIINTIVGNAISAANTDDTDMNTYGTRVGAATHYYGFVALTPSDITGVSWSTNGSQVIATGVVGSGKAKDFKADLSGLANKLIPDTGNSNANAVIQFTADDGSAFWMKSFDTTDLDGTTVSSGLQGAQLALLLVDKLTTLTVTTIKHAPFDTIDTASRT